MRNHFTKTIAAGFVFLAMGSAPVMADTDCAPIAKDVSAQITKDPSITLKVLTEALEKNEECACEIVQAAIKASKADSEAVGQIVEAAITTSTSMANTIVECATAVAPDAIDEIEAAYRRAMGDAAGGGYTLSPTALGGVYLVSPQAPAEIDIIEDDDDDVPPTMKPPGDETTDDDPTPGRPSDDEEV